MMRRTILYLFYTFLLPLQLVGKPLEEMSVEEKVGQLFITYFDGEEFNSDAKALIETGKIGGIIYYNSSNALKSPQKIQVLSDNLQSCAMQALSTPLFIAVDQEGGLVARLKKGFTPFPGNGALGLIGDQKLTEQTSLAMHKEMHAVGVNMNFGPVVDINTNPSNPVIGIRSFGNDKKAVTLLGNAFANGAKKIGVVPCLKHFPGHGDTKKDSHYCLPVVDKSYEELLEEELFPFKMLASTQPAIMTAHVLYPLVDRSNCATLSPTFLQNILRKELGFQGVIITDSLTMKGVCPKKEDLAKITKQAFLAGNDILLIGQRRLQDRKEGSLCVKETLHAIKSMVDAVKTGEISMDKLDASVARILALKKRARISSYPRKKKTLNILQSKEHLHLSKEVAYRSLDIRKYDQQESLRKKKVAIVAPKLLEKVMVSACASIEQKDLFLFSRLSPTKEEALSIIEQAKGYDFVVFFSYNAWKTAEQKELLQDIAKLKPTAVVATRDAADLLLAEGAKIQIATRSPSSIAMQVASDFLFDSLEPITLTLEEAAEISDQIWQNEAGKKEELLTFWNPNEPFPSMGTGHYIWPPKSYQGIFASGSFHELIDFMKNKGAKVPTWLLKARHCPWENREAFYKDFQSRKMKKLRAFLLETIPYQTSFMVYRINRTFKSLVLAAPREDRTSIIEQFFALASTPKGVYTLIDYLNFKGNGINPKERYNGIGWGLLQVLSEMAKEPNKSYPTQKLFAKNALKVLQRRVKNSPNPELQKKWIPGWTNRICTYYDLKAELKTGDSKK